MKGMIDEGGYLHLERARKLKIQMCMHKDLFCGDWCPLFGEPKNRQVKSRIVTSINVCESVLIFIHGIIDKRKGK